MERARSISSDCHLPSFLWIEAVFHATYLVNRSPTRANSGVTPEARYSSTIPNVSDLKIFGCLAYVHVPKENRKKLDSKTTKCLFLGFDNETKAYRLYDQGRRKVIISRDVVFDETKVGLKYLDTDEPDKIVFQNTETVDTEPNGQTEPHTPEPTTQADVDS